MPCPRAVCRGLRRWLSTTISADANAKPVLLDRDPGGIRDGIRRAAGHLFRNTLARSRTVQFRRDRVEAWKTRMACGHFPPGSETRIAHSPISTTNKFAWAAPTLPASSAFDDLPCSDGILIVTGSTSASAPEPLRTIRGRSSATVWRPGKSPDLRTLGRR